MANLRRRLIQIFKDIDRNKDGFIDFEELQTEMKKQGFEDAQINELLKKVDVDQNGMINLKEFINNFEIEEDTSNGNS